MRLVDKGAGAYAMSDLRNAHERVRDALEINPDNGYALLMLGAIYERSGREASARATYAGIVSSQGDERKVTVGVQATERAALAALARERLARLGKAGRVKAGDGDELALSSDTVEAVFDNLRKITDDLHTLSSSVRAVATRAEEEEPNAPMMPVPVADGKDGEAPARTQTAVAAVEPEPAASPPAPGIRMHLVSFRTAKMARKGRDETWKEHADLLDGLGFDLARVDLGPGMGVFYRVLAGPVASEADARSLCSRLRARGAFCALVFE
ncbi:MAG: SPOR domain-containing protein [Alphaproteobacteria bacterium]